MDVLFVTAIVLFGRLLLSSDSSCKIFGGPAEELPQITAAFAVLEDICRCCFFWFVFVYEPLLILLPSFVSYRCKSAHRKCSSTNGVLHHPTLAVYSLIKEIWLECLVYCLLACSKLNQHHQMAVAMTTIAAATATGMTAATAPATTATAATAAAMAVLWRFSFYC